MCTLFPVLFPAVPGGARPPPPPGSPPGFHWRMLAEACPCPRWLLRLPEGTGSRPTHRAIWSQDTTEGGLSCRREGRGGGTGSVRAWGPKPGGRLNGEDQIDPVLPPGAGPGARRAVFAQGGANTLWNELRLVGDPTGRRGRPGSEPALMECLLFAGGVWALGIQQGPEDACSRGAYILVGEDEQETRDLIRK